MLFTFNYSLIAIFQVRTKFENLNIVDGAIGDGQNGGGPELGLDDGAEAVHVADVAALNVQDWPQTLKILTKIM